MGACPPVFNNYKDTYEIVGGNCFEGFFYYPNNIISNGLVQLSVPPNVAYDYNTNAITVDGLPVAPDCYGEWLATAAFRTTFLNRLTGQINYAGDVAKSLNPFFGYTACVAGTRSWYYLMVNGTRETLVDSAGRALLIFAAVYT